MGRNSENSIGFCLSECKKILHSHPLFSSLPENLIEELASHFVIQYYSPGQIVVSQGEIVDSIYFIKKGKAEVTQSDSSGHKIPLRVLNRHESIGLSQTGLYSKTGKRSATVTALSDLILFRLDLKIFYAFLNKYPVLNEALKGDLELLKIDFIKQAAPFAELATDTLYSFAKRVKDLYIPAGSILFEKGDSASECYLLCSGKIEIFLRIEEGAAEKSISILSPSAIFGETALLMKAPRNASAKALEDSHLLIISEALLLEVTGKENTALDALMNMVFLRSRPIRHEDIEYYHAKTPEGDIEITLKDSQNWKYFRLSERGWFIWQQLDGQHSVRDITLEFFEKFQIFNPELVASLIIDLEHSGFLTLHEGKTSADLPASLSWGLKFFISLKKVMEKKYAFQGVDEWVTKTYKKGVYLLFAPVAWFIFILVSLIGFGFFCANFDHSVKVLQMTGHFKWLLIALSIPPVMLIAVFHELMHAYTTKFFGRKVRGFGVGWFWLGPIAFCDTSDMWLSPKKQRVWVDLAGICLHFVIAGALSIIFVFISNPYLSLFCWYLALLNYFMIFENLSPIIELDGYYALMDGLDHPNLKVEAVQWAAGWPQTFSQFKLHKAEAIYWVSCIAYLILEFIFPLVVLNYLLKGLFGISNPLWSLLLSFFVVFSSALGIWGEINHSRLKKRKV